MENLNFLGLAKKAGKIETGEEQVSTLLTAKKARLIVFTKDASEHVRRKIEPLAEETSVPCIEIPFSKEELGNSTGKMVCAVAAIKDIGFAAAFVDKLVSNGGQEYTEIRDLLKSKAKRADERKKEQKTHEKNVRLGSKRRK